MNDKEIQDTAKEARQDTIWDVYDEPVWHCLCCGQENFAWLEWCIKCWGPRDGDPNE